MIAGAGAVVYDCEVFSHDWLFVFKHGGRYAAVWNDPAALKHLLDAHEGFVFVGYNSSRYDQFILKAILAGCDEGEVKEVNDFIIEGDEPPWEHPYLDGFFYRFNDVDLMKDTQIGTSLKSIEGHTGISIEESSVPFGIDRPLTDEERREVEAYCKADVDATERLMADRTDYLLTKARLGELAGIDAPKALSMTNAKLTAALLGAIRAEHEDERAYVYPENLLADAIPSEVFRFFDRMADPAVPDDELWKGKLRIEVGGCPVTLGFGGIHGALPKWRGDNGPGSRLVLADVTSYYPSLMIENGYTSRNIPRPEKFAEIYRRRLAAKASGDLVMANTLKLVVNTAYGAMLNPYNDLYDPLMARSVCVSGQLYLLELATRLADGVAGLSIVQLNTDGVLVSAPGTEKAERAFSDICGEWQRRTSFALEFDRVERVRQKDVNNYAMRLCSGSEKVKGAYLVRGVSKAGAYSINNNAVIVAEALRRYLLDDVPVEKSILACDDPRKFQLVAKASRKYAEVYQEMNAPEGPRRVPVQRCNRVYASPDESLGALYKVKAADQSRARIESLPEHCLVHNRGHAPLSEIDKQWYVALARKRARDFEEGEDMTEPNTASKAPARRAPAKTGGDYGKMNVHRKLSKARCLFLEAGVKKSGINRHLEFEYFQLDDIVAAQTRIFDEVGLLEVFTFNKEDDSGENDCGKEAYGTATVYNLDEPLDFIEFRLRWRDLPPTKSRDGKLVTNPLQDDGKVQTYLRRYLKMQVLDLSDPDESDAELGEPERAPSASASKPRAAVNAAKKTGSKPATAAERERIAEEISGASGAATALQTGQLRKQLKKLKDAYGDRHPEVGAYIAKLGLETDNLRSISKERCEQAIIDLGEMKEGFDGEQAPAKGGE